MTEKYYYKHLIRTKQIKIKMTLRHNTDRRRPRADANYSDKRRIIKPIREGLLCHPVPPARKPFRRFNGRGKEIATLNGEALAGRAAQSASHHKYY
jgi:hypothetical protein